MIFEKPGKENTKDALSCAIKASTDRGIKHIVFSSNTGYSLDVLLELGIPEGLDITIVTSTVGFKAPNEWQFGEDNKKKAAEHGIHICTAAHTLSGIERSLSTRFSGIYPAETVAYTLRMFGAGTKVAVEIAAMAADAGFVPVNEPIIALGGTGRGLDTAWILKAANSHALLDMKMEECLCKPLV